MRSLLRAVAIGSAVPWLAVLCGCIGLESEEDTVEAGGGTTAFVDDDDDAGGLDCDPETFASICDEGRVVECTEPGKVRARSCGDRSRCQLGADGADCVWRLGEPCDSDFRRCDEPGGILACEDGRWTFEPCPTGGACSDAQCFGPDDVACDWPDAPSRCEADALVECWPHGFEVATPCEPGQVCREGETAASCVSEEAEPCGAGSTSRCVAERVIEVCGAQGWTEQIRCGDGDRCFEGSAGATCQDETLQACDPATAPATCEDGVAAQCTPTGHEIEQMCGRDEECRVDETCIWGCQQSAACVPLDAAPCEEPVDLFCDGGDLAICFDGQRLLVVEDCDCTESDGGPACAFE